MKRIKEFIKKNWILGIVKIVQLFLVGQISFYFLKEIIQFDFVRSILNNNEKYYLSFYNGIQFVVTYILFIGIGFAIEEYLNWWIRRNEADILIKIDRDDKRSISIIIYSVFRILVFLKLLSINDLDRLDEVQRSPEEHEKKWKRTILIWKNTIGLLVLGLTTTIITWEADGLCKAVR
jgi:NhaP-type Na+/H+ or K+/H+ antiporter